MKQNMHIISATNLNQQNSSYSTFQQAHMSVTLRDIILICTARTQVRMASREALAENFAHMKEPQTQQ